jgi:hypothetical protein
VLATALVGGVSAAVCLAVVATIWAHERDRVSLRDRIVVDLMVANTVYSTANAIPLNAVSNDIQTCGRQVLSFAVVRFGRAWWFCGKFGLVACELFILVASIRALVRRPSALPVRTEMGLHLACVAVAALAFAVFYTLCAEINASGYNRCVESAPQIQSG